MKTFQEFLEMAQPQSYHTKVTYYHGSKLTNDEIRDVMRNGLDSKYSDKKYIGAEDLKPKEGLVYLTTKPEIAFSYAVVPTTYDKNKEDVKYVIFEIKGNVLNDIFPDEDELSAILKDIFSKEDLDYMESELKASAMKALSKEEIESLKTDKNINTLTKKVYDYLSDNQVFYILDNGNNVANKGVVRPTRAYVLDKNKISEVKNVRDFFEKAVVVD